LAVSATGASIPVTAFRVMTRGRSRMRQFRKYGSVRGVLGNRHSYRDPRRTGPTGYPRFSG
ncbi:hypothetical protein, partial [Sulfuricella sp.]|uniref:hypothetical protein n=1 Tax=Sulfuricella sp. TaxID=2099377 RepID=UPI002C26DBC6